MLVKQKQIICILVINSENLLLSFMRSVICHDIYYTLILTVYFFQAH